MLPIVLFCLALVSDSSQPPWQDLVFTIAPEPGISADTVTLCRVRVTNNGSRTFAGHAIHFEAQALEGGTVVERARGRFGLMLAPHESLETLIGFTGRYERFTVLPLTKASERVNERGRGKRTGTRKGKRRRS